MRVRDGSHESGHGFDFEDAWPILEGCTGTAMAVYKSTLDSGPVARIFYPTGP